MAEGDAWHEEWDDEPVLEIQVLSDVVPLDGVDISAGISSSPDGEQWWEDEQPRPVFGRPVVGSVLTGLGLAGTLTASALPWSAGRTLPGIHALTTQQSWLLWLLASIVAAIIFGVLALIRPRPAVRWWGAASALAGAALSGWAVVGLPDESSVGVGPGLACAALVVLAVGQSWAGLTGNTQATWRWRPAAVAGVVVVGVLVAAGLVSSGLVRSRDIDATTSPAPLAAISGDAPSTVDSKVWGETARVYDVAGSVALVVGQHQRGTVPLPGVSVLDLHTGQERWHHYERGWRIREATLTEDGSIALVVVDTANESDAIGFDAATGVVRWRQRLAVSVNCRYPGSDEISPIGGCAGELVVGDGLLYVSALGPGDVLPVTYLDAETGRKWPMRLPPGCRLRGAGGDASGVYVLQQCVTAGFPDPHLVSETAVAYTQSGTERWSTSLALVQGTVAGVFGPVFIRGDVVFVQQEQRYVALASANGGQLWSSVEDLEPETVVTDGTYLAWSTGVEVIMFNLHTGDLVWQHHWRFPEEADLPLLAGGRLYLIQHTVGPNPYTCAEHSTLLTLTAATGDPLQGRPLPAGAGNDCGPDVEDRSFLRGQLLVLLTGNTISVLTGH